MTQTTTTPEFVFIRTDCLDGERPLPRVVDAAWLGRELAEARNYDEDMAFRLYWFTADGEAVECRLEAQRLTPYNENDYARAVYQVMTPRGTALAEVSYSVDGRA